MEPVLDLYLDKINEVITNTTVADNIFPVSDVNLLTNEDGSPRQSPPRTRFEYGDDAKELLFKITGTAGVASDPVNLGIILGGQPVKNNLNVKISENDYRTQVIEIFPLGLLDIEIMEDDLQIKPGPTEEKYTGTFVACGLEAEDVYKMYQSNQLPNGNVRGNELKRMIENQGLVSDMITKTREIYFEPVGEDCVKVHFGIDGDDGVTASGLQEDMLSTDDTIELVDDDGATVGRLSDLELSSERRFEVEVTTDLPPGQIISRLENEPNSPEFEKIENIRETEDGKTVFDFVTDRNLNIVPANFPALEDKIDSILESDDAKIRVPGTDLIPLRQYIGTVRVQSDEASVAPILANYLDPINIGLNLPEQWVIDYQAAVELDVIEAYIAAEISFGTKRVDIVNEVSELLDSGNTFTLNAPRAFRGKCLMLDAIEPELLNKTIHEFVIGLNSNLKTSAIYQGVDIVYAFGRQRRQAAEEELEVKFYFQSLDAERLIPAQLEAQGKRIIAGNPSFATLYASNSLEITPQMFEEDITPVTLPTSEPTLEPTTTEPTSVEPTVITIDVEPEDPNKNTAPPPTIPPVVTRNAISVFNCTEEPSDGDNLIAKLESEIASNCPKTEQVDCSNTVVRDNGVFIVQCKYTVTADKENTIDDVEESLDSCLPKEVDCLKHDKSYIDHPTRNKCMDAFENDCNVETSVCDYNDEVVCKCIEGYEKKDENDIKSACVPTGPDVVLIILIVLIIILFLVILLLSYFVHQKRTKTGMYSPSKHQPTQIQS